MSMEPEQLYNIVLRPADPTISERFVAAAQGMDVVSGGYHLNGKDALAHVTLCMFRAPSHEAALEAFNGWQAERQLTVTLAEFGINGKTDAQGKINWVAIDTVKSDDLLALQSDCHAYLTQLGFKPVQAPETYRPHFTLLNSRYEVPMQDNPADLPSGLEIPCAVTIGISSEMGVFLAPLTSPSVKPIGTIRQQMKP